MPKLKLTWLILLVFLLIDTASGQTYLEKFKFYKEWSQKLPLSPDQTFINFIDDVSPLSQKLREKWLYQLAYNKNWVLYTQHYQPTHDVNLQCYESIGLYTLGQREQALSIAKTLWLNGHSQPIACDRLFNMLLKNHEVNDALILQRLVLALDQGNVSLASYLLQQFKPPRLDEISILNLIHQRPRKILQLHFSALHREFYLYGLKRLIRINLNEAIQFWQHSKTKQFLTPTQQQLFIAEVAKHKAIQNERDALHWFLKVNPTFYNEDLLSAQIRFALKYKQWAQVENLIKRSNDHENPCWQYWLARALEAQGQKEQSYEIYQNLAKTRNYYGFLASLRIHQRFSFKNENAVNDIQLLLPYRPFTDEIKSLYITKQTGQASRLLNDFMSELPKEDKSALTYWIDHDLHWHGKSVYLSNSDDLNNQLSLRFPLAYQNTVSAYSKNYQIPKELIYAIIRQESAFRDDVISSAGAHGLMQVMPTTAKAISKREKIAYFDKNQLFSSQKNINIGVAYLKELAKRFNDHPILMIAAYNAGPRQANYWLKNHSPNEMDIWIETLPWHETRNYLKNVIAFYAVYQFRMHQKTDLSPFMREFSNHKERPQ